MNTQRSLSGPRVVTVVGLVVGALGIAILWASGVKFPIYPPPGGFLISPSGLTNLFGQAGTSVAIGQGIQVIGVLTALIAGAIATRANYRKQAQASQ